MATFFRWYLFFRSRRYGRIHALRQAFEVTRFWRERGYVRGVLPPKEA